MKKCSVCGVEKELSEFYSQEKTNSKGEKYTYYRPDCISCVKGKAKEWAMLNPEMARTSKLKHKKNPYAREKEKIRDRKRRSEGKLRKWQQENKNKLYIYNVNRNKSKRHEIMENEWEFCKGYFNYSCAYCGISEEEHRRIHRQQLHKEHAVDKGANDISNCIPACKECNSSKHDKDYDEWYVDGKIIYDIERKNKINKWLNGDWKLSKMI